MAVTTKRSSQPQHPLSTNECSPLLSTKKSNQTNYSSNNRQNEKSNLKSKNKVERNLGTFEGVFLPTSLNVLSILMFLRFGFIIGQMGILGTLFLLILSYSIDILTTLSISAISTNGTVKGGGAYYMISRSLGPEFGGAIGIIFVIGQILNSSLNVVGFIEPLLVNFGVGGDMTNLYQWVIYGWFCIPQYYWPFVLVLPWLVHCLFPKLHFSFRYIDHQYSFNSNFYLLC